MISKAEVTDIGVVIGAAVAIVVATLVAAHSMSLGFTIATGVVAWLVLAATVLWQRLRPLVVRMRRTPLRARSLDLGEFRMPRPAPRLLMRPLGVELLPVLVLLAGVSVAAGVGVAAVAVVALAVGGVLAGMPVLVLGALLLRDWRSGLRARSVVAGSAAVDQLAPEVILYFAGSADELYQLQMWFPPVAALGRRTLVVVRSDLVMDQLRGAPFPVVCSTYNGVIATLPLPAKVLTFFVTHSGNNLSMVRRRETYCVFIGHGDSDKPDSSNPYARLYDEVWVAGPLGRRRYAEAAISVRDDAIHEVGRPQLAAPEGPAPQPPVVVYAPTWEGWGDDEHHSSLSHVGVALVDALLSAGVEVRYRPHPLTGQRDPTLRQANRAIVARVGRVPASEPLGTTLDGATALVADVSSVVSEYLGYDRPYAVADTRGLGRRAFVRRFPSAAGAFLLGADLVGLDAFLAAARGGKDATSRARRVLIADVLGDPATAQQRFAAEVERVLRQ